MKAATKEVHVRLNANYQSLPDTFKLRSSAVKHRFSLFPRGLFDMLNYRLFIVTLKLDNLTSVELRWLSLSFTDTLAHIKVQTSLMLSF